MVCRVSAHQPAWSRGSHPACLPPCSRLSNTPFPSLALSLGRTPLRSETGREMVCESPLVMRCQVGIRGLLSWLTDPTIDIDDKLFRRNPSRAKGSSAGLSASPARSAPDLRKLYVAESAGIKGVTNKNRRHFLIFL